MYKLVADGEVRGWSRPAPWRSNVEDGAERSDEETNAILAAMDDSERRKHPEDRELVTSRGMMKPSCRDYMAQPTIMALIVIMLLLLSAMFAGAALAMESIDDLQHWSQMPWMLGECRIIDKGIQYVGDCKASSGTTMRDSEGPPNFTYTSCLWNGTEEETPCLDDAWTTFESGRRLYKARHVMRHVAAETGGFQAPIHHCRDVYLPWALAMAFDGRTTCGYDVGLPCKMLKGTKWIELPCISGLKNLDEAQKVLASYPELGLPGKCWLLSLTKDLAGCRSLAMQNPLVWPDAQADRLTFLRSEQLFIGVIAVALVVYAWYLVNGLRGSFTDHWKDLHGHTGNWHGIDEDGNPDHDASVDGLVAANSSCGAKASCVGSGASGLIESMAQSATPEDKAQLLRKQWSLFKAGIASEYQPVATQDDDDVRESQEIEMVQPKKKCRVCGTSGVDFAGNPCAVKGCEFGKQAAAQAKGSKRSKGADDT